MQSVEGLPSDDWKNVDFNIKRLKKNRERILEISEKLPMKSQTKIFQLLDEIERVIGSWQRLKNV